MIRRVAARRAFWALACIGAATAACSETSSHVFAGAAYDPATRCLGSVEAADVLDGRDPGRCPQTVCWLNPYNGVAYVSVLMCDGPPDWRRYDKIGSATVCDDALATYAQVGVNSCLPDGGVVDAGGMDAEAGLSASDAEAEE